MILSYWRSIGYVATEFPKGFATKLLTFFGDNKMKLRNKFLIGILCLALALPAIASVQIRLGVSQDAYIQMDTPNTNYDGEWLVARKEPVDQSRKIYIQFDFSNYSGSVLDIDNFEFFHSSYFRPRAGTVYLISGNDADNWNEATITWNNAPGNDVSSSTGFLNNDDFTATFIGNVAAPAANTAQTVGLVWDNETLKHEVINKLNSGSRKVTFAIVRTTDRIVSYASKENVTSTVHPIRMDITVDGIDGKMIAEPESREVYYDSQILETSGEVARAGYNSDPYFDGNLVLAFKLPELPSGKVISSATFNFFYIQHASQRNWPNNDLYALPYVNGSQTPVTFADYYVGTGDTGNIKITANVLDTSGPGYQKGKWLGSDATSKLLAAYLQQQYENGAVAGDWVKLRFSPLQMMTYHQNHNLFGPNALDELNKPYISYQLADASEGYWKVLSFETMESILDGGIADPNVAEGYLGASNQETMALWLPFQLPALDAGEYVSEVMFSADLSNPYMFPGRYFDIDLYGLPYRSTTSLQASDYWLGAYSVLPEEGLNGTPIASSVTEDYIYSQPSRWQLDEEGSLRAACYINEQLGSGATSSDYGFFRMNPRYDHLYYTRQMINNPDIAVRVANAAPSCPAEAPETEYACPLIGYTNPELPNPYPVGDLDGDCMVTLADLQIMFEDWLVCYAEPASYYCP
jgi:hypothetical protein